MSARRLIPCLDVSKGRVVKGVRFEDVEAVGDPLELARRYEAQGADEIVLLEITATAQGYGPAQDLVVRMAERLRIPLTVGGGVRTEQDALGLLDRGADRVALNSAALREPDLLTRLAARFGRQAVVVAVDYRDEGEGHYGVYARAGTERQKVELTAWLREAEHCGAGEFLLTAIGRDGTGLGYDLDGLRRARQATSLPIIASGGAGSVQDVIDVLSDGAADAALLASRLHSGEMQLPDLRRALHERGVEIRWDAFTGPGQGSGRARPTGLRSRGPLRRS